MLRSIPTSALACEAEGIIPADAVASGAALDRALEQIQARAAAQDEDIEQALADARDSGFRAGFVLAYRDALEALLTGLVVRLEDVSVLRGGGLDLLEHTVREALADQGVEAALIARCIQQLDSATAPPVQVIVPETQADLHASLAPLVQAHGVDLRLAPVPHPLLDLGEQVLELDPQWPGDRIRQAAWEEMDWIGLAQRRVDAFMTAARRNFPEASLAPTGRDDSQTWSTTDDN